MEIFIRYYLLGFTVALPVGAITIEMTKQGLKNGFLHGWAVGLGGMTIDFSLIIALYLGFASILSLPYIQMPLWIIGACFLAFIGYDSIKNEAKSHRGHFGKPTEMAYWSLFLQGILSSGFLYLARCYQIHTALSAPEALQSQPSRFYWQS